MGPGSIFEDRSKVKADDSNNNLPTRQVGSDFDLIKTGLTIFSILL